jgi:hypothetical protein
MLRPTHRLKRALYCVCAGNVNCVFIFCPSIPIPIPTPTPIINPTAIGTRSGSRTAPRSRLVALRLLPVPIGVGVGIGIGIDSDWWLVLTHGVACRYPIFVVSSASQRFGPARLCGSAFPSGESAPHPVLMSKFDLLSFDSDSDPDPDSDSDYKPYSDRDA